MLVDILEQIYHCQSELSILQTKTQKNSLKIAQYKVRLDKLKKRLDHYGKLLYPQKIYLCWGKTKQNTPFKMYMVVSNDNEIEPLLNYHLGGLLEFNCKEVPLLYNIVS